MKTKYFVPVYYVQIIVTLLAMMFAVLSAQRVQAMEAENSSPALGAVLLQEIDYVCYDPILTNTPPNLPGCTGQANSVKEAPEKKDKDVVVKIVPTVSPTASPEKPVVTVTETSTPTQTPTEIPEIPTATPSPEVPQECPLNVNRAGHTNHSCDHPDTRSGQLHTTEHGNKP